MCEYEDDDVYGNLTKIGEKKSRKGYQLFVCRCICGLIVIRKKQDVKNGAVTSCGVCPEVPLLSSAKSSWRIRVLSRDNYVCQKCQLTCHNDELDAHHIDGRHRFPERSQDVSNGITLCRSCHKNFHMKYTYDWHSREDLQVWLLTNFQ